jgi:uncharacterized repeat protein (TIGR02543 family)
MKMQKLLTTLTIAMVVLMSGCKKDEYQAKVGLCPLVVSTIPADKAVNVPLNQVVSATFNEKMDPAMFTQDNVTLVGTTTIAGTKAATTVTGTVVFSGMTVFFTPTSPLTPNTTYTGKIKAGVKDLMGNALQADYVWSFSTDVSPTVSADPINNSVDVLLSKIVIATFSVPMDTLTLKALATTVIVKQGTTVVPGKYSFTTTTASFKPDVALSPFTVYTTTITTAAKNTLGTPLAANYEWSFTTIPQINVSALPVLGGTVAGGGTFAQGSSVTVTATPSAGYTFTNWTEGVTVVSTTASYQLNMAGNKTLVANFAIITYTLGVTAVNGTVAKLPNTATYNIGATVVLTPTPATGFVFTSWSGDATGTANPLTVTMNANKNITANFTAIPVGPFTLDVTAVNGTVAKLPNAATYVSGATVVLTPTPATGFVFSSWSGDATGTANPMTVTMNANKNITANFTAIPIGSFTLNVTAVNGTVAKLPSTATYISGATVVLTPTPATGFVFSSWSGDATGTANPLTVTMNANKNITANFTAIPVGPFTLNVTAVNGTVVKLPSTATYNNGTNVALTATPNQGYSFTSWSGDASGNLSSATVMMNGNKNVTANFTLIPVGNCPVVVDLGMSGDYVILSKAGISTTGITSVTGNMGVSPAAATSITGFNLILTAASPFSTSSLVTGHIFAPDYNAPTPVNLTTAINNMQTAFTAANGLLIPAPTNEYMAGNLNGQTLTKGIYKWSSNVLVTSGIILDGGNDPCATFIFQIAGDLTVANSTNITLINGAKAKNIFWVVAGSKAALGTGVDFSGNILCKELISLNTGAKVNGKLLAQTGVTLIASTVTDPQ